MLPRYEGDTENILSAAAEAVNLMMVQKFKL